jgi:hypothetical protein
MTFFQATRNPNLYCNDVITVIRSSRQKSTKCSDMYLCNDTGWSCSPFTTVTLSFSTSCFVCISCKICHNRHLIQGMSLYCGWRLTVTSQLPTVGNEHKLSHWGMWQPPLDLGGFNSADTSYFDWPIKKPISIILMF